MTILLSHNQREHFIDRPPWSPYWSDSFKTSIPWYSECCENKKNLVICYGDSWTWGDSLGTAKWALNISDEEYRLKHIYACQLAQKLDADFANCAIPGIFNFWIQDRLTILLEQDLNRLSKRYDKIWVVVTLTEVGRDFVFENYIRDFQKFWNFAVNNITESFVQCEKFDFVHIARIQKQLPTNCILIVGRNFTDTYAENKALVQNLIPKTWTEIIAEQQQLPLESSTAIMSHGLGNFDDFVTAHNLNSTAYKEWMAKTIMPNAQKRIDLLNKSMYNKHKTGSCHPTEQGHALWADYIYSYINESSRS